MTDSLTDLNEACAALEKLDDAAALTAILRAWQKVRSSEIAEVIESLSLRFDIASRRPHGGTIATRRTQWLTIANEHNPTNTASLLATLDVDVNAEQLTERVKVLGEGDPDPRIGAHLVAMMRHPGSGRINDGWRPFWTEVLKTIRAMGDPRGAPFGQEITRQISLTAAPKARWFNPEMATTVFASLAAHEPNIDPSIADAIAKLRSSLAGAHGSTRGTVTELFEKVYENPADDAARAVLADLLQEIRDPRGELITLQLSKKGNKKRESALLKENRNTWLGGLAPIIKEKSAITFRRGFLEECSITCEDPEIANAIITRPEWATVTSLTLNESYKEPWRGDTAKLLSSGAMRSLREVSGIFASTLAELTRPLTTLTKVTLINASESAQHELTRADSMLPNLTHLDVGHATFGTSHAALFFSPLVHRLKVFEGTVSSSREAIDSLEGALREAVRLQAERITIRQSDWLWGLLRSEDSSLSILTVTYTGSFGYIGGEFEDTIRALLAVAPMKVVRMETGGKTNANLQKSMRELVENLKRDYPAISFEI